MALTIRRVERDDAGAILDLIAALAHYEKLEPPDAGARSRLIDDGFGERPRFEAWLAAENRMPVGYAIFFETYSTFLARPTLYLEDLFVLPEFRGRGIGYALFRKVASLAVERECGRMEWCCLNWNSSALEFYKRIGAKPLDEWTYLRLLPEQIAVLPETAKSPPFAPEWT